MIRHPSTVGRLGKLYSTLFMRRQLRDPEVRRKAWPDYTFGCKRILFSSHYLPALERDNVELVTDRVTAIEPDGVRTDDGRHHPADVLIWGTGFKTTEFMFPMDVVGRDGRTLQEEWSDGAHAHLGMTVPGFPSLFVLYGPNTNTSGGSIIVFLEAQVAYVRQALEETARRRAAAWRCAATSSRRSTGGSRPSSRARRGPSATPGTATSRAASSPTGRTTWSSTSGPSPGSTRPSTTSSRDSCPQALSTLGTNYTPVITGPDPAGV